MRCTRCGKELSESAKFCDQCGLAIEQKRSTYSYGYKKPKKEIPEAQPASGTDPKPAAPQGKSGGMGCLSWILILVCLYCFYSSVIKPLSKKQDLIDSSDSTTAAVEETMSREEAEMQSQAERLPGISEDFMDLPFFSNRLAGSCKALEGDVAVTVLFMNDLESSWTQEKMDAFLTDVYNACWELTFEAADWGKELNFTVHTTQGYVAEVVDPELAYLSFRQHIESAGYSTVPSECLSQLQMQTYSDTVPVIVVFNKPGRSYACPNTNEIVNVEHCYIFDDPSALKHELLHLFGAADFYYHDYLNWSVGQYLGDSIMASTGGPVDDMTAYLIGWTDTLTEDANLFLYSADFVGKDAMLEADQGNTLSGYATKTYEGGSVYTGMLSMGVPDGTGEMVWGNGDRYNGDWVQGQLSGYGTFSWANGTTYVGQFLNGKLHGQGTMTYNDGQVRSGYWENGEFVG